MRVNNIFFILKIRFHPRCITFYFKIQGICVKIEYHGYCDHHLQNRFFFLRQYCIIKIVHISYNA